jgi:hypothetical protein
MSKNLEEDTRFTANEKLLGSKAFVLLAIDNDKNDWSMTIDVSKLSQIEMVGFMRLVQDKLLEFESSLYETSEEEPAD